MARSADDSGWVADHPIVALAVMTGLFGLMALSALRRSVERWRTSQPRSSVGLAALRDVVGLSALLVLLAMPLTVEAAGQGSAGPFAYAVLPAALLAGFMQLLVLMTRRAERRRAAAQMRAHGLPTRSRMMPWWTVALLVWLTGPFVLVAIAIVIALPSAVLGRDPEELLNDVLGLILLVGWMLAAFGLTAAQWWRQLRADNRYWASLRPLLRTGQAPRTP